MSDRLRDFRPDLRAAIERLHRAGFDGEAYVLAAALEGAYGSALEMVRSIGGAVARVQRSLEGAAPIDVGAALDSVLREIGRTVAVLTPSMTTEIEPPAPLTACGPN